MHPRRRKGVVPVLRRVHRTFRRPNVRQVRVEVPLGRILQDDLVLSQIKNRSPKPSNLDLPNILCRTKGWTDVCLPPRRGVLVWVRLLRVQATDIEAMIAGFES